MSSLPLRTTRDKLPTSNRRDTAINAANKIILLLKITFVFFVCGSSYLAGSIWGRHSLEEHDAPLSVGSLMKGGPYGSLFHGDAEGANDVECEETRKKWIEHRVHEGMIGITFIRVNLSEFFVLTSFMTCFDVRTKKVR